MVDPVTEYFDIFSGRDTKFAALAGATVTGPSLGWLTTKPRRVVSMQVSYTGFSVVKVALEGTIDGTNWYPLALFDTGAASVSGDIVSGSSHAVLAVRANALTLTGAGTVTAAITGTSLGS